MKVDSIPHEPGAVSNSTHVALPENARNTLRPMVEALGQQMSALSSVDIAADRAAINALRESWHELVDALSLGAAPETRACPTCAYLVMRAASRCESCWSKLVPEPSRNRPVTVREG
jgi:hypothetical protein